MSALPRLIQAGGQWLGANDGRVLILHGLNMVVKNSKSPEEIGFDERSAALMAERGFNVVRLGVPWCNVEAFQGDYDGKFLASIKRTVAMLAKYRIYSLIDFHQDAYSAAYGFGAPSWAVVQGGTCYPDPGFPYNLFGGQHYFQQPDSPLVKYYNVRSDIGVALDAFWDNETVLGNGLQDHYAAMLKFVAGALKDERGNILGYEIMNEPTPGAEWTDSLKAFSPFDLSGGCEDFDTDKLAAFYDKVIPSLRAGDPEAMIWFEPNSLFGIGAPTFLPMMDFDNLGFSFHNYDNDSEFKRPVKNVFDYVDSTNLPILATEFGATTETDQIIEAEAVFDKAMLSTIYWAYFNNPVFRFASDERIPADPREQAIVIDPSESLEDSSNVNFDMLTALTRVYPRKVGGTPVSFFYDPDTKIFDLTYATRLPDGKTADVHTEVFVPPSLYPNGYVVKVKGGQAVSEAGDAQLEILADKDVKTVAVQVKPIA